MAIGSPHENATFSHGFNFGGSEKEGLTFGARLDPRIQSPGQRRTRIMSAAAQNPVPPIVPGDPQPQPPSPGPPPIGPLPDPPAPTPPSPAPAPLPPLEPLPEPAKI